MVNISFQKEVPMSKTPPKMWLGMLGLLVGIFLILVYFNIIPSQEKISDYDRLIILFISISFAVVGIYIISYNINKKIINSIFSKITFFMFSLSMLIAFHIAAYIEYLRINSFYDIFLNNRWVLFLILAIFDLIFIYVIVYSLIKILKKK